MEFIPLLTTFLIRRNVGMEKRIKDFEDYAITDDGKVISYKYIY